MSQIAAAIHLSEVAHEVVSWASKELKAIATLDWVLIAFALAIAYFLRKSLLAVTRVGQVEVELLDCDAGNKAEVRALTATLRERLANSGLPAPVVPSGAPQAGLISAIAASPLPQGAFIARLVEALPMPEPLQYKLSGTLFEKEKRPGISIWLRPSSNGRPLMRTMKGRETGPGETKYQELIKASAFEVYSFISTQAVQAFPTWARWHSADALEQYTAGASAASNGEFDQARKLLSKAELKEPDNALVCLQLANVYERIATDDNPYSDRQRRSILSANERKASARSQAETLRRYLWIADEWAWLVQARYRASVLAAALARNCEDDEEAQKGAVEGLGLIPDSEATVKSTLETIAQSESDFALQLLKPWYMLARWRRLRSQFEPSADERRQLKRAVSISRHCRRLRALRPSKLPPVQLWIWLQVTYTEVAVRGWHLFFGLIRVDWQTHYVASCFEALLLEHAWRRHPGEVEHG